MKENPEEGVKFFSQLDSREKSYLFTAARMEIANNYFEELFESLKESKMRQYELKFEDLIAEDFSFN